MRLYICENRPDIIPDIESKKKYPGEKNSAVFAKKCICDYLRTESAETDILFAYNAYGKPLIKSIRTKDGEFIDTPVHFSLSHSKNIIICAAAGFNIGADCQKISISNAVRCKKIARRFYADEENNYLNAFADDEEYIDNFFSIWAKKEAYVKYTGKGLAEGLNTFSVVNARDGQKNLCGGAVFKEIRLKGDFHVAVCAGWTDINHLDVKYI